MQTTLLGLGFALILALAAALVGPLYYDWDGHRDLIDDWLGHVTGLEVQVGGRINARFLPTPTLTAQEVEFGRRGDSNKTRARELRVEGPVDGGHAPTPELGGDAIPPQRLSDEADAAARVLGLRHGR